MLDDVRKIRPCLTVVFIDCEGYRFLYVRDLSGQLDALEAKEELLLHSFVCDTCPHLAMGEHLPALILDRLIHFPNALPKYVC